MDDALKRKNLAQAEAALHALLTGGRTASASINGRSVSYTQASIKDLQAYIASLKIDLGLMGRRRWLGAYS